MAEKLVKALTELKEKEVLDMVQEYTVGFFPRTLRRYNMRRIYV
jgi:hypothetical protein